ncbi:MAG TPA: lysine--tRNA ligase [Candidatus Saccharimonadales bacterium]|nr:lysine--tRNA ligase [Candidatus Saccharimonadales bacterium]
MQWLNNIVEELIRRHPDGEIVVSSGVSPSGTYHLGTFREVLTAEVIMRELKRRGRKSRHLHIVDDLDIFRKVPVDVPAEFEKYLGKPLCDVPAPDGSDRSYADFFLSDLLEAGEKLHLQMEVVRSHEKYRAGFFVPAIEKALEHVDDIRQVLEDISGRKLDEQWSPVQILEDGYLKNRQFKSIDKEKHLVEYVDKEGSVKVTSYAAGEVKLNWRIDWPARWWLLNVQVEPFGRDHATKGGSYDTGVAIVRDVFGAEPPFPVPYNFINRTGDTKKMSKSSGDTITAAELLDVLPPEIVWFFILRYGPEKLLFFDEGETLMRLFDEFAELLAKPEKTAQDNQLLELCLYGVEESTVSRVPFTLLVTSYQASLKDANKTLEVIKRTEYSKVATEDAETIVNELKFIDTWLQKRAPEDVKFELSDTADPTNFSEQERTFLSKLSDKIAQAPADADGGWFHNAVYEMKDESGLEPKAMFSALYRVLINKDSGPRAGWFLSILPRDWLIARLKFDNNSKPKSAIN